MSPVEIEKVLLGIFLKGAEYEKVTEKRYRSFSYPKLVKMMRFKTRLYVVPGFGHVFSMRTKGPFGMELLTLSFTPGEGKEVPFLLIDIMSVGRKRTVFVEYYDRTASGARCAALEEVKKRYDHLTDYHEKPHWYVGERASYSLIKGGTAKDEGQLEAMVRDSVKAYRKECHAANSDPANLPGLNEFRRRMIEEGNPSSSVLEKVFGKEGAREFFVECVMPESQEEINGEVIKKETFHS